MSRPQWIENLNPIERREFLALVSTVLGLPFIDSEFAKKCQSLLLPQAHAQTVNSINFLEVNFRDQWDFGHAILAPSLARNADSLKSRDLAFYDQQSSLIQGPNNLWLTRQGAPLQPHANDIAVMELGEPCIGSIHAHEAGNGMRSPGRSYTQRSGTKDMASVDKRPKVGGNEVLYSSSPTPAVLHNYFSKQQGQTRNGIIFRSSIRENTHTFYHFEGNLANAQLDRFFNKDSFLRAFGNLPSQPPITQSTLQKHGQKLGELLRYVDGNFFSRKPSVADGRTSHEAMLNEWSRNFQVPQQQPVNVNLTQQEIPYWTQNVPSQKNCPGDSANNCTDVSGKANLGEIYGWISKLFIGGIVKTAAIDYDFHDVHGARNRLVLDTQARATAEPLARFIQAMKGAGIWNRTLIAMYTLDGGRGPNSNSTGERTKNALILAGGMVKGGYYGDIAYNNGWVWKRPDDNGVPVAGTTDGRQGRVPNADVYKTVAKAAGVADSLVNNFPDARNGKVLTYMLK